MSPSVDLGAIAPMLGVGLGAVLLPLAEVLLARKRTILGTQLTRERRGTYLAFVAALVLGIALLLSMATGGTGRSFQPARPLLVVDGVGSFLNAVVLIGSLLVVLASSKYLAAIRANLGEFYALMLASVTGMLFLVSATHLVLLLLALELASLPICALIGIRRESLRASEAALKFLVNHAVSSAVLLYGSALLYGATGSLDLREIGLRFDPENGLALLGAGLVVAGLAWKIAAVPFHHWMPDTLEGAPTTVSALLATALVVASFGALARVFYLALPPAAELLYAVLWVLAVASMTIGNLMALVQQSLKRVLAYSGVAHSGYLLVGFVVGGTQGLSAVLFYLAAYLFMTLGAYAVLSALAREGREYQRIEDLEGLVHAHPGLGVALALCSLSLLGVPGTAGFVAKFGVMSAGVERAIATGDGWMLGLVVVAALNVALSAAYYLRIAAAVLTRSTRTDLPQSAAGTFDRAVVFICGAGCLLLGLAPHSALLLVPMDVLRLAEVAAASLH